MRGNFCPSRHFYLDRDRELLQPASSTTSTSDKRKAGTKKFSFSSLLTVKVRKEVARERREELDLETDRRRSWVETREYEVLDLTGNFTVSSPALAHLPSRPISSGDTEEAPADSQQFPARQHSGPRSVLLIKCFLISLALSLFSSRNLSNVAAPDPDLCGGCQQKFKGKRGLTSHQARAANKACRDQRGGK